MMPASALSVCAVVMLCVAFSRRMCCSRVCSVSTNPRRPSTSVGLAGDPAGHAAQVLLLRGEEAEARAAVVEPVAERLALPHRDVDAEVAGRAQDAERDRVALDDHDARRSPSPRRRAPRGPRPRRGSSGTAGRPRTRRRRARRPSAPASVTPVRERDLLDRRPPARAGGRERLARVRVQAARDEEAPAAVLLVGEPAGRRDRRRRLVERGVRDRQPGQLRDRRLVLEHHLQRPLGDLRLVRRVRRQELRARQDRVDQRRHVVVVHARPEERDLVLGRDVLRGEVAQVPVDLLLGLAGGQVDRPPEPHPFGHVGEQLVDRLRADRREHRAAIVVGGGGVAAHG